MSGNPGRGRGRGLSMQDAPRPGPGGPADHPAVCRDCRALFGSIPAGNASARRSAKLAIRHDMRRGGPVGSADQLLALDVGTQSVRALLFDPRGALIASGRVPIEPYVSPQPGWAEQDPEVWWAAIGEACRRLWAQPRRAARCRRRCGPDHPASDDRRRRRGGTPAPAGDRLARPAPDGGAEAHRRPVGRRLPGRRRDRDRRPLPGRRGGQLDRAPRAGRLAADPALRRALVVADRPPRRPLGRLVGRPGRLPAVRLQALALGRPPRLEVAGRAASTGRGCRSSSTRPGRSAS